MLVNCLLAATLDPTSARIEDAIARTRHDFPNVGVTVAVARDGKVIFAKGYGYASLNQKTPVTKDSPYHICSITKHLVACEVLKLAQKGKLDIHDNLGRYVTAFKGRKTTLEQLLSHTSGIQSYTETRVFQDNEQSNWPRNAIVQLMAKSTPQFPGGKAWRYNNGGFYLLGLVIEKVTHKPFAKAMEDDIFRPLGMTETSIGKANPVGHLWVKGKGQEMPFNWQPVYSAGAIVSTAGDLLRFEQALNRGKIVSPALVACMRRPHQLPYGPAIDYGWGTRIGSLDGHPAYGHTGSGAGFGAVLFNMPKDHLQVVVLMNAEGAFRRTLLCSRVARAALNMPLQEPHPIPITEDMKQAAYGRYESSDGRIELRASGSGIQVRFGALPDFVDGGVYVGNNTAVVGEDESVRLFYRNGVLEWFQSYEGGLFSDASRREDLVD